MEANARKLVKARAKNHCECRMVHQDHVELPHHVEHIVARKHGGADDLSNLALACERCNLFKGPDLTGIDPQTGRIERLYHPRVEIRDQHFELRGPLILGRTAIGRATVEVLAMNAGQRLQLRAALIAHGLYP